MTLVFTGNLEQLEKPLNQSELACRRIRRLSGPSGTVVVLSTQRDVAVTKAKLAGAKVTSAVSGRTTYLAVGSVLEDGRPIEEGAKFRKTQELKAAGKPGPSLLQESEFIEKLQKAGLMKAGSAIGKRASKTTAR
ncbi:replication factor C subunit 1 [Perkinsus olseni]|uniref:Replication factor C subunit 1 n=1 Tax=Perkinsus olseni TaxID=32597 RepID=A0A7J6TL86_PEROL|nr:replication factor C subunit 1 [Perkinsus olseni]